MKYKFGKYPKYPWWRRMLQRPKDQKVKIKIDPWDIWNVYLTVSSMLVPLLKHYRKNIFGAPYVDQEDLPPHLRSEVEDPPTKIMHEQWEYVVDAMIWAFEYDKDSLMDDCFDDSNDTGGKFDKEKYDALHKKLMNGRWLFAKYFDALWT